MKLSGRSKYASPDPNECYQADTIIIAILDYLTI